MRLNYADPETITGEDKAIVDKIAARRAPRPIQPLDRALLLSPKIAEGWNLFLGAIRSSGFDQGLKELAICRIAVLNRADYEWEAHAPLAVKNGIPEALLETVRQEEITDVGAKVGIVLNYVDQMTRQVDVSQDTFDALRSFFSEQEIFELTATVAAYNCVSRLLVALDIGEKSSNK